MRVAVVVLTVALLISPSAMQAVHGQQATQSSPTPTRTTVSPSPIPAPVPSGHSLLKLMTKAITLRNAVRVNSRSLSTWKGHWILGVTWMDVGIQSNTLREIDTWQRVRPNASPLTITMETRELRLAHEMAASRKPHHPWLCERLRGITVTDSLIAFQMKSANVTTLGTAKAGGESVWHVRASGAEVAAWSTHSAIVDLYISRTDDTLVRLTLTTVTRLGGVNVHEMVTESYSRYGEPVKVRLPTHCR